MFFEPKILREIGYERHRGDPLDLASLPVPLFEKGEQQKVTVTYTGTWKDRPVTAFEMWWGTFPGQRPPLGLGSVPTDRRHHRHGALIEVQSWFPPTVIESGNVVAGAITDLVERVTGQDSGRPFVNVGGEFASRFQVESADGAFARALLTEDVRGWVMERGQDWTLELAGRYVIVHRSPLRRPDIRPLLRTAVRFLEQVPAELMERSGP